MPVIVNTRHPNPWGPLPGSDSAIGITRARHQDIRPLEVLVINLMKDKQTTGNLLSKFLGASPLQVNLTFGVTDKWMDKFERGEASDATPPEYIRQFVHPYSEIKGKKFDGFVLSGYNARKESVGAELLYAETAQIIQDMTENATSSLYLCYGAKAALKHRHNIESFQQPDKAKYFGVFNFTQVPHQDETGVLRSLPDVFPVPVARMKSPCADEIFANPRLKVLATSVESGPGIIVETAISKGEKYTKHLYVMPHPEYTPEVMIKEYDRDVKNGVNIPFPVGLFRNNDRNQGAINSWRHTGRIYTDWVESVYKATPFDRSQISENYRGSTRGRAPVNV